jgi:capsular exopolysaccharide synthesis family protein
MTLADYLRVFRRRWPIILICTVVAAAAMWLVTPASAGRAQEVKSYTATATLLVGGKNGGEEQTPVSMGRIALYLTNGEIPRRAAKALGYDGDPALLASGLKVEPDMTAMALTVAASAPDGERAADVANTFAQQAVKFFEKSRPGAENVDLAILQQATPIPDESSGGFVVPPGRGIRTLLAGALGMLLGLGLAIIMDRLDSRLRSRNDIHEALRMPIIAEIPKMSRALRSRGAIVAEDPLSVYADGYRAARTALVHTVSRQLPDEYTPRRSADRRTTTSGARVILVTSAYPAEGKSTSAANLAASFAETGLRVLVLDADLRSPDAHNHFDVPQGAGISDFLSDHGETALGTLIRPTSIPGVRIITAGTRLANPASLASRMGLLLNEAREIADVVIVDSAPLLAASDVFDVLPMVDTVLLVVRSGRLTTAAGNRVSELLGRFQVPVAGALIVGASKRRRSGYGYGYGYSYGEQKKSKKKRGRAVVARQDIGPVEADASRTELAPDSRRARRPA